MVTAFVLVNAEDRKAKEIAKCLVALKGVTEAHVVAGEYDLVAVVRVPTNHDLSELITEEVVHIDGVHRTKTLFAMQSLSDYDLVGIFGEG